MKNEEKHRWRTKSVALVLALFVLSCWGADGGLQSAMAASSDPCCYDTREGCEGNDGAFVEEMQAAQAAAEAARLTSAQQARDQGAEAAAKNKATAFMGDIGDKYCFSDYSQGFEVLHSLFFGFVQTALNALVNLATSFLDRVCEAAVTYVNNALEQICIPLPGISLPGFNLDYGPLPHGYCEGRDVPLSKYIGMRHEPLMSPMLPVFPSTGQMISRTPLVRGFRDGTVWK